MVLLRPLLAFTNHNNLLNLAQTYFTSILEPFKSAKLPCAIEISRFSNLDGLLNGSSPPELMETLLNTPQSTLILYLPGDSSLSLQIQTPYQHPQTYPCIAPFTLKTSFPSSPDGEISFDALSDAESPIMSAVEESLSVATSQFLGRSWRKVELREFENQRRRIRVELRRFNGSGKIIAVHNGSEETECINRSLQDVLTSISST
jgi:hypothetical protein